MKDLKTNLLRHHQREQLNSEIEQSERMLQRAKPEDAPVIKAGIARAKRQLTTQSPEPLTGKEKDTLATLEKKLLKKITTNMPTEEVMRKNPAGAVDWHTRWEKQNKSLIRVWKNIRIQLNPDNNDRDLANIERFRPQGQANRIRTDAQIVGAMSYSDIPDEQWPFEAPTNTALEQAKRNNTITELEAEAAVNQALEESDLLADDVDTEDVEAVDQKPDGRKREVSPERHAILVQRLADARAIRKQKLEQERQLDETLTAVPDAKAV